MILTFKPKHPNCFEEAATSFLTSIEEQYTFESEIVYFLLSVLPGDLPLCGLMFLISAVALKVARREGRTWRIVGMVALIFSLIFGALQILGGTKIPPQRSSPALVFKGYARSSTNAAQFAKFELQNRSEEPIWLAFTGQCFPLNPPFLERPLATVPNVTNQNSNNIYRIRVGSFFSTVKQVSAGDTVALDFPLVMGKSPEQVGVSYYYGKFKDGNDFLNAIIVPFLNSSAGLKERAHFYWEQFKQEFRKPRRGETWCLDPLRFQATGDLTNRIEINSAE